jgi:hypothetical protein
MSLSLGELAVLAQNLKKSLLPMDVMVVEPW